MNSGVTDTETIRPDESGGVDLMSNIEAVGGARS